MIKDWLRYRYFRHKYGARVESEFVALTFVPGNGVVVKPGAFVARSTVGAWTYIGYYAEVSAADVGPYCSIAPLATVGANEHFMHLPSTSETLYPPLVISALRERNAERTLVGPDVWIGAKAVVRKGVSIGVGAVVGAGAVVTSDVAPYDVVVGVPARRVRSRFSPEIVNQLIRSQWWERPHADIRAALNQIRHHKPPSAEAGVQAFLETLGEGA